MTTTCIHKSGVRLHGFTDGSLGVMLDKQAMHFGPDQAEALRSFVRLLDKHKAPVTILTEAHDIIHGERAQAYGPAEESLDRIRAMWRGIFGRDVTRSQVCLAMIAMKVAREANLHKRDNLVDICGYAAILAKVSGE